MAWSITPEHKAQGTAHGYLDRALPDGALCTAIDHAGKSSAQAWQRLLKRGVIPGIHDWYILWRNITVWAEQKTPDGSIGDNQVIFRDRVVANGGTSGFFVTLHELHELVASAGIPIAPPNSWETAKMDVAPVVRGATKKRSSSSAGPRAKKPSVRQVARIEAMRSRVPF